MRKIRERIKNWKPKGKEYAYFKTLYGKRYLKALKARLTPQEQRAWIPMGKEYHSPHAKALREKGLIEAKNNPLKAEKNTNALFYGK